MTSHVPSCACGRAVTMLLLGLCTCNLFLMATAREQCSAGDATCGTIHGGGPQVSWVDITVGTRSGMPVFGSANGLPRTWRSMLASADEGDEWTESWVNMGAHTGTHVDAPRHFLPDGATMEDMDLERLIGPCLVVQVPSSTNVTGAALEALHVHPETERLLLKTANSERGLMSQREFAADYTGVDASGAAWLVAHMPQLQMVGIDYLSIATLEDVATPHQLLFRQGVAVVEGLDLTRVDPGPCHITCLPAKWEGSDGAPVRCILAQAAAGAAAAEIL